MRILSIGLLFISNIAFAEPYLDLGIAEGSTGYKHNRGSFYCDRIDRCHQQLDKINGPFGIIEFGYDKAFNINNISVFYLHISSIPDRHESGFNLIGFKYRLK